MHITPRPGTARRWGRGRGFLWRGHFSDHGIFHSGASHLSKHMVAEVTTPKPHRPSASHKDKVFSPRGPIRFAGLGVITVFGRRNDHFRQGFLDSKEGRACEP